MRCAICRDTWFATPDGRPAPSPDPAAQPQVAIVAASPPAKAAPRWRGRVLALAALVALAVAGGSLILAAALERWVADGRGMLSRLAAPRTVGLEFRQVTSELTGQESDRVLSVEGEIANVARQDVQVPPLAILVRSGEEQVLAAWTDAPPRTTLGPGEVVRFATRLASPPPGGDHVRVQFSTPAGPAIARR